MKMHDLKPRPGAKRPRKRVGRGISAGQGKTAGRGTKGAGARSGIGGKLFHQGGNLPFYRRLPFKRGFNNIHRRDWQQVNLEKLVRFADGEEVGPQTLLDAGIIDHPSNPVVILGKGDLKAALKIRAHRFSAGARAKIEAAGGSAELLES